ncbi:MAG TPA: hypothetical protein VIT91_15660 [Chthoniobacterales bacterium]
MRKRPVRGVQGRGLPATVSAYSLRAKKRPTVSTPVLWEEVEAAWKKRDAGSLVFESDAVLRRVEEHGDLFAPVLELKQRLPSIKRLGRNSITADGADSLISLSGGVQTAKATGTPSGFEIHV